MPNMVRSAKKHHSEVIAAKLARVKSGALYNGYKKDLEKLNYTTLVVLSPRVK